MSKQIKSEACCCSWGGVCQQIRDEILKYPSGAYDMWKQPHIQIKCSLTEKNNKFVSVIQRHLGIKEHHSSTFKIAPHHFQLSLLQHRQQFKKMQWMKPLTREEAIMFGNSTAKIDLHSKSKQGTKLFFQTPNVPKSELLFFLKQLNDDNCQQLQRKQHESLPQPGQECCHDSKLMSAVNCEKYSSQESTSLIVDCNAETDSPVEVKNETISEIEDEVTLMSAICCESTQQHCLETKTSLNNNKPEQTQQNNHSKDFDDMDLWYEDNCETKLMYQQEGTVSEAINHNDTGYNGIEVKCCGLQHFRIQMYLCSDDDKFAKSRGKAIHFWKYEHNNGKKWFSFNCCGSYFADSTADRDGMCLACFTETKKI